MTSAAPNPVQQPGVGVSGYVESLRRERDRFVALAFCAADLLLEINAEGRITFAAGATQSLVGKPPESLSGTLFLDLMARQDRPLMAEFLRGMTPGSRLDPVPIRLAAGDKATPPMSLTGYHLPDLPGCFFFALRLGAAVSVVDRAATLDRDPASGLLNRESFAEIASEQMREAEKRGESLKLTMLRTQNLPQLRSSMDKEASESLMRTLGACLQANSASGQTAARLDEESYGLVHRATLDIDGIRDRIQEMIKAADPKGVGVEVSAGTVDADADGMNAEDSTRVLLYTINRFCETGGAGIDMESMSENLKKMTQETTKALNSFRDVVRNEQFEVAFQPIVSLATHEIHHYEALTRFNGDIGKSPYKMITFAENTGIIADFDLAMCRKVLDWIHKTNRSGQEYTVAVNLSGRSIANTAFISALHELLAPNKDVRAQLMFEITESAKIHDLEAANAFIQGLRRSGHRVCLDDFGAGSAALKYLHALEVDVVKIDGQYIKSAMTKKRYQAFLKAVVGLCHDLGVATIAECIEDQKCVNMLQKCGVKLGQGYLFGKPSFDIAAFRSHPPAMSAAANASSAWRPAQGYRSY
jgi:EAL domain-containing protein (putative c-di-GMP-specific phosphodiesterase class I)/GGDEF domain-containing protein